MYYQRASATTLATVLSSSSTGATFGPGQQISTQAFSAPFTLPNFDPFTAVCYMGDYISLTSDGTNLHAAWGDNRDTLTDGLYPSGRADPDVFHARR